MATFEGEPLRPLSLGKRADGLCCLGCGWVRHCLAEVAMVLNAAVVLWKLGTLNLSSRSITFGPRSFYQRARTRFLHARAEVAEGLRNAWLLRQSFPCRRISTRPNISKRRGGNSNRNTRPRKLGEAEARLHAKAVRLELEGFDHQMSYDFLI